MSHEAAFFLGVNCCTRYLHTVSRKTPSFLLFPTFVVSSLNRRVKGRERNNEKQRRRQNGNKRDNQQNVSPEEPASNMTKRKEIDSPQDKLVFPFTIPTTFPNHPLPVFSFTSGSKL